MGLPRISPKRQTPQFRMVKQANTVRPYGSKEYPEAVASGLCFIYCDMTKVPFQVYQYVLQYHIYYLSYSNIR